MKILNLLLYALVFFLNNNLIAQCDLCEDEMEILNPGFENFDFECIPGPFGLGFARFDCVDNWTVFNSPDLFSSDFTNDFGYSPELSSLLTSSVGGICYGLGSSHSETIRSNYEFSSIPNVSYDISVDVAAFSTDLIEFQELLDIPAGGQLTVRVSDNLSKSIPIDNSFHIGNGFQTVCFEDMKANDANNELQFISQTNTPTIGRTNFILLDNVSMRCQIDNSNLGINEVKQLYLEYKFSLDQIDPNLYTTNVTEVLWNFGDGNESTLLEPSHIFSSAGTYTVTASIKNEIGCCTVITKEIIITESCADVTLSGISNVDDLLAILNLSSTIDLMDPATIATVEIDGVLQVDRNVVIGENLNFVLTQGSKIDINSDITFSKNGGFIGPCEDRFEGIFLNNGSVADFQNTNIWGAVTAINMGNNAQLFSFQNTIEDSYVGVIFRENSRIESFTNNVFSNCSAGLYALNIGYELILTGGNNIFENCNHGIRLKDSGGKITRQNFINCGVGILVDNSPIATLINLNNISASIMGVQVLNTGPIVTVRNNLIGTNGGIPETGVFIKSSSAIIEANGLIAATTEGIRAITPLFLTIWENDNIVVDGNNPNGIGSYGIYIFNLNEGVIKSNNISGNMSHNINCIACDGTDIGDNFLTGAAVHGILMQGGVGSFIGNNHLLTNPWIGIGLNSHNGSLIHFNEIRAQNTGLWVKELSHTQVIGCNIFLSQNRDIATRAVLSPQYHHNNVFQKFGTVAITEGLDQNEVLSSMFTVDECIISGAIINGESQCDHPESWTEQEFFLIQEYDPNIPSYNCKFPPLEENPSYLEIESEYWCWLFQKIHSENKSNLIKSWVDRYKALKLLNYNYDLWDLEDCIPHFNSYCNMDQILEIENSITELIKQVQLNNDKSTYIIGVQNKIKDLELINCPDPIFDLYKKTYKYLLKSSISNEFTIQELDEIRTTAELCSHMYGDPVYWARGILDEIGEKRDFEEVNCTFEITEKNDLRSPQIPIINEIDITPNPASDMLIIENNSEFEELDVKLSDSFGKIHNIPQKLFEALIIDSSKFIPGLYFLSIQHKSGFQITKKIIISR